MKFSEVHLHLEGAIYKEALQKIEKRRFIKTYKHSELPTREDFFKRMNFISNEILTCKQDYLDTFEALCDRLSTTHDYVELTVSPRAYDFYHEGDFGEILSELSNEAIKESRLKINFLIDLLRNSGIDESWSYLDFAKKSFDNLSNIVGISLAGDEIKYPTEDYMSHIIKAKEDGFKVTVHAGEWGSADNVWRALEAGADRIGHGIRSVDDKSLLERLSKKKVMLEICPTSNLYTGASRDLNELVILANSGVNFIINTDNPAVFNTSLKDELNLFRRLVKNYEFKEPFLFDKKSRTL